MIVSFGSKITFFNKLSNSGNYDINIIINVYNFTNYYV